MTAQEIARVGDAIGEVSAVMTFVAERAGNRYRSRLAQLRAQALIIDKETQVVQQLPDTAQPTVDPYDEEITSKPVYPLGFTR